MLERADYMVQKLKAVAGSGGGIEVGAEYDRRWRPTARTVRSIQAIADVCHGPAAGHGVVDGEERVDRQAGWRTDQREPDG